MLTALQQRHVTIFEHIKFTVIIPEIESGRGGREVVRREEKDKRMIGERNI